MKDSPPGMARLETSLGYRFRDANLLRIALTPPSTGLHPDNQRMEFFGDAILQACISELIFREKPEWNEGAMSKLRGMLVCTETLYEWAQALELELTRGPRSVKQAALATARKPWADAMEAIIAAVFLDARQAGEDPHAVVAGIVERKFLQQVQQASIGIWRDRDSKTTLQERAAALALPAPEYLLVERGGPDHAPRFTVQAQVGDAIAKATSGTLKGAQMAAARILLASLEEGPPPSSA